MRARGGGVEKERTVVLDAAEDVVDVVWEEAAGVEHCLDQARDGTEWHVLPVCVLVPLEDASAGAPEQKRRRVEIQGRQEPASRGTVTGEKGVAVSSIEDHGCRSEGETERREGSEDNADTHFQALLDLLHEHVPVCRKAVDGEHRTVRSVRPRQPRVVPSKRAPIAHENAHETAA
jgi:hypothetical protein